MGFDVLLIKEKEKEKEKDNMNTVVVSRFRSYINNLEYYVTSS